MIIARLICEITRGSVTTYEKVSEKVKEFVDAIRQKFKESENGETEIVTTNFEIPNEIMLVE